MDNNPPVNDNPVPPPGPTPPLSSDSPTPLDSSAPLNTDPIAFAPEPFVPAAPGSKRPLIIGAVIAALVVAGGVFGLLWFMNYTKPETMALDAMTNLFRAKAIEAEGSLEINFNNSAFGLAGIKIDIGASSALLPSSLTSSITITTADDDETTVYLDTIMLAEGSIFFKISNILETLTAAESEETIDFLSLFAEEIAALDDQWYKLDLNELASSFGAAIDTSSFDCTIDALNSLNTDSARSSFVDAYKDNQFILVEPTNTTKNGGNGATATIDSTKSRAFKSALDAAGTFAELEACEDTTAIEPLIEGTVATQITDPPTVTLYVSTWGHELTALDISYADDNIDIEGSFTLSFPDQVDISAPSGAKSLISLIETILPKYMLFLPPNSSDIRPQETTDCSPDGTTDCDATEEDLM